MIKIAVVQEYAHEYLLNNLETTQQYASEAAQRGCSVICFPECYLTGYRPDKAVCNAISLNAPALQQVSKIATENAIDILVGFMEKSDDSFYITHGLFRKDGTRDYYRKTHLGQREKTVFSPGKELKILSLTNGTRIGIQLCVETHYPEITQTLALRGAEVVFAPHAVPRISGNREKIWSKYIPARSYDNRIYMACCNLWDNTSFGGGCLVTGPRGEVVSACFDDKAFLLVCEIDEDLIASFRTLGNKRSAHFYPSLRRPELYE